MKKLISILGSTGSIGLSTLKILNKKKNTFRPYIFIANGNVKLISNQIKEFQPLFFFINNQTAFKFIKSRFKNHKTKIFNKFDISLIKKKSDITISAIPGINGLLPTIHMIKKSKKVLIANKESIICAWNIICQNSKKYKTKIIPIDSEHFSISKIIHNTNLGQIEKVYLTASGGPFLKFNIKKLKKIQPKQAINHPKWKMGKKISVDSATMMNKVLEYIEAQKLFNLKKSQLKIIIHPESLVHAIVKFKNGFSIFIYHDTSMVVPIANAIFGNKVNIKSIYKPINKIENLTFQTPNSEIFPVIKLLNKVNQFPSSSIIVNACNEVLVENFLRKNVPFLGIPTILKTILNDRNFKKYAIQKPKNIKGIIKIDKWARHRTINKIKIKYG